MRVTKASSKDERGFIWDRTDRYDELRQGTNLKTWWVVPEPPITTILFKRAIAKPRTVVGHTESCPRNQKRTLGAP